MIEGTVAICGSIAAIEVDDSRVTIHSGLQNDARGRGAGVGICNLIQAADVADFTPGHELQDGAGETIKVCPPRSIKRILAAGHSEQRIE